MTTTSLDTARIAVEEYLDRRHARQLVSLELEQAAELLEESPEMRSSTSADALAVQLSTLLAWPHLPLGGDSAARVAHAAWRALTACGREEQAADLAARRADRLFSGLRARWPGQAGDRTAPAVWIAEEWRRQPPIRQDSLDEVKGRCWTLVVADLDGIEDHYRRHRLSGGSPDPWVWELRKATVDAVLAFPASRLRDAELRKSHDDLVAHALRVVGAHFSVDNFVGRSSRDAVEQYRSLSEAMQEGVRNLHSLVATLDRLNQKGGKGR